MLPSTLTLLSLALSAVAQLSNLTTPNLNLTALSARDGESTLECWQLANPFQQTTESGITGSLQLSLGELANASYSVVPARFDGGFHHAPAFQYVLFISGLVHISLYKGKDEAWIQGGKYGLIIAADTADRTTHGHLTRYPSAADTVAVSLPIKDRDGFKYSVLHQGPCTEDEVVGL
ncbi:hypothetical protein J3459_013583 [Metarhizium acridum]|uniref:Small secreted protein n=1 Tax=Metarhizium acridum (strain CQMa 102) TaxID=655827 RepID=E9EHQ0_METAQ|nr:uncharacterized protein MAC_09398 [Metarhizium acridum CQMa 102]EFY84552.1 hypothetical protein MAC_09398 [Metarhizium acridum CQMa 102]KAG8412822.1 hypothetical protein J3458_013258 [Metarhizium acridum]KAG8416861.1 hypothetical protein J3459_013583 [Metarhizium acridum]